MNCDKCTPVCSLPICATSINLGTITPDTTVQVVFTEIVTGRKIKIEATSDSEGNLIVDVEDYRVFFSPNFMYEIALFSAITNDCPDIELTINDVVVSCVQVRFFVCTDNPVTEAVLSLQSTNNPLLDEDSDPLLDEHFNPLLS